MGNVVSTSNVLATYFTPTEIARNPVSWLSLAAGKSSHNLLEINSHFRVHCTLIFAAIMTPIRRAPSNNAFSVDDEVDNNPV